VVIATPRSSANSSPDIARQLTQLNIPIFVAEDHAGLRKAWEMGHTHALMIGSQGKLFAEDLSKLIDLAATHPTFLILGKRENLTGGFTDRLGRWLSNLVVGTETNRKITDSQCGLRVYPLNLISNLPCRSRHPGIDIELLVRATWAGAPLVETTVQSTGQRNPLLHLMPLALLHLKLLLIATNPFGRANVPPGSVPRHSLIWQFLHWLNPLTAWRQVRRSEAARARFAAGCAAGVFIANLPIYGGQTILALYTAKRFRLHPASTMAGVHISVPPIGPILIALGIAIGHLILHGSWHKLASYHLTPGQWRTTLFPMLCEWVIGSIVLGTLMGLATFFLMDLALRLIPDPPETEQS
jgi:uncharacterized protein (DUF2062 family)